MLSEEARVLLRKCFEAFRSKLVRAAELSIETSHDLFAMDRLVSEREAHEFNSKRQDWVKRFDKALCDLFENRLAGQRRHRRRPDTDESLGSVQLLNAVDQARQTALRKATKRLAELSDVELEAIDLRVRALLGESATQDIDNPFSPLYVLDAIGMASRSVYPNTRVWRPLMERVVTDIVPDVSRVYVQLNRFLADGQVLPEVGANLRARSALRPANDRDLLSTFNRLINEVDPSRHSWRMPTTPFPSDAGHDVVTPRVNPYVAAVAQVRPRSAPTNTAPGGLPQLEPLLALGSTSPIVAALDQWQRDDPVALRSGAPAGIDAVVVPINRIPWIHAALADQVEEEGDRVIFDTIGLLFDYIFRDPSIPVELHSVFDRLQVPVLKAALVDQSFFADEKHPARRLLDELAAAAVGATNDNGYREAFERLALQLVEAICKNFFLGVGVFDAAAENLKEFIAADQLATSSALSKHIAAELAAEAGHGDRARVRAFIRNRLAGADIPFDVRAFVNTVWADYLTDVGQREGIDGESWRAAVQTIDDMLWSITIKERTGQKVRLSKMIPPMVRSLRAGGAAVHVPDEWMQRFLATLYEFHMAAIKPAQATLGSTQGIGRNGSMEGQSCQPLPEAWTKIGNIHDFVGELVVGTWLAFHKDGAVVNARLSWISPLRITYLFTSRSQGNSFVFTPDELAWEISAGKVDLLVEPVPLFDRAISAALAFLAAHGKANKPGSSIKDAPAHQPPARNSRATMRTVEAHG